MEQFLSAIGGGAVVSVPTLLFLAYKFGSFDTSFKSIFRRIDRIERWQDSHDSTTDFGGD